MNTILQRTFTILSIVAFANIFVEQIAQANTNQPVDSISELTRKSKGDSSQGISILLANPNIKEESFAANDEAATSDLVTHPEQTKSETLFLSTPVQEKEIPAHSNDKLTQRRRDIGPSAPNYFGIGGSLGLVENTFGDFGAFAVTSKFRLLSLMDSPEGGTDVSFRPSVIVGDEVTFAVPVTVDVRLEPFIDISGNEAIVPYFGPGVVITTGDDSVLKFLMAGGLDVPIGEFTTNAQVNIGFFDDTALGLTLSVGYNF